MLQTDVMQFIQLYQLVQSMQKSNNLGMFFADFET